MKYLLKHLIAMLLGQRGRQSVLYNVQKVSEDSMALSLQVMFSNKLKLRLEPNVSSVMTAASGHIYDISIVFAYGYMQVHVHK